MKIQLSISLLASNRAESLERCLDSLRPLMMQIPSELIVVFTGTDERVREIASRYTDKIIPFAWCDNFSAARNVGLWAAKGEWFLYIDDDEWFEDTSEIRDFFLSGEYKDYGSALYKQKNFADWNGINYSDFHAFRMVKIIPGIAFQNTVHEELMPKPEPWKYFDTYVNHYGYVSDSGKLSLEKSTRNLPLLLQNIQERPSYIKNYLQIVQEYVIMGELEKAEDYCRRGRRLCQGYKDNFYSSWLQVNLVTILYEKEDYQKAEKEALAILSKEDPWELACLELYATLLAIYTKRNASKKILHYGLLFEKTLSYMDQKPELWLQQSYGDLTEKRIKMPSKLYQIRLSCTEAALKQKNEEQAAYFFGLLPWEEESWMQRYYPTFDSWKNQYVDGYKKLLDICPEFSPYFLLQKAFYQEAAYQEQCKLLKQCLEKTESLYLQRQIIREIVVHQMNLAEIISVIDLDTWKQCTVNVNELFGNNESELLEAAVMKLVQDIPIYGLWLKRILCERKLIHGYLTGDALIQNLAKYSGYTVQFYRIQYRDDLFAKEKIVLLPKDCRFALLTLEALEKVESNEFPEAIRLFRNALRFAPGMTGVIREVLRQISVRVENPVQNTDKEFLMLAHQMKKILQAMLDAEQYPQALQIILQLSSLLPEDLELLRIRQKVLQEIANER